MRRLWPDSLFARLLLAQALLYGSAVLIFAVLFTTERLALLAQPYAALAAPALRAMAATPTLEWGSSGPGYPDGIHRESGPPTGLRLPSLLSPSRIGREELARHGVIVDEIWLVPRLDRTDLWMSLHVGDGASFWVSVSHFPYLASWSRRMTVGLVLVLVIAWLVSRYFARRITRPLARLHTRMSEHAGTGVARAGSRPEDTARDPPELRAMDEAYSQLAERLARNERERALLLAGVSHDLRSPLARIRLAAEMLPETPDNSDGVAAITRNVDQTDRLIGSFLEFVRAGTQKLDETVDASAAVRRALAGFERPPHELASQVAEGLVLRNASALLLERLVVNLVENALKHGRPPVQVLLVGDTQALQLAVTDSGPGLPEGGAERLLEAFARGDTSRGVPGFGLGLAIVHQIVTRLQGQLHFERSPQQGHSVQVTVPLDR